MSSTIKTVTVLGAGDMGHGIAEVALIAGFKVFLRDVKQEYVDKGVGRIYDSLDILVKKGKVSADHYEKIKKDLLIPCVDLADSVKESDLVIEAIPEIMELKKETWKEVDRAAPQHTLFASNTSTMSITEIASITKRPDKFFGLHYFNPVVIMKLVEVIKGDQTSEETMKIGYDFVQKNNKIPVYVKKDVPGFIVNRVQSPSAVLLNCILDQKIAEPEEVDAIMRSLGMPMGPYEVIDYTGIDINYYASSYFAETIHPDFALGSTLKSKYDSGELGKKTGKGIFDWTNGRPDIDLSKKTDKFDPMDMVAVNANEAAKIVEMGACTFEDVDTAIVNATGSPVGLITMIKSIPVDELCNRLENLADKFSKEIFKPSQLIKEGAYV
ncbi:MAG: 3-hydroxyacyl-CoA dehydrogenase family protein [Desulfobacterales bacterium]|nr:3-hydroxyacyl-CoA dehydrogenase family protein [Desulfobacterales bacterium]MCP4158766.1 3-hydroxyacyl-CoA dehydrogenase family protein [Deltaproteobacteria bacterium]